MSHHGKHQHSPARTEAAQQEHLEALAYQLWEEAGRPEGQAARFWKEAEERSKESRQPVAASSD
jgi:hypothetical protein